MTTSQFLNDIELELGLPAGTIKPEQKFRETRYWDSLAEIAFVAMVEEKLGVLLTPTQMREQTTIQDLLNLLKDQLTVE